MFADAESVRAALAARPLTGDVIDLLVGVARPAAVLDATAVADEATIPLGATKIGGYPDLPPHLDWPARPAYPDAEDRSAFYLRLLTATRPGSDLPSDAYEGDIRLRARLPATSMPLSFVAQVDLGTIQRSGATDLDLPGSGRLLLFYDLVEMPWGYAPDESIGFAVRYDDSPLEAIERRPLPPELAMLRARDAYLPPQAVSVRGTLTPIPAEEVASEGLAVSDGGLAAYRDWQVEASEQERWQAHRVGGWPSIVQGEMRTQCALVSAGYAGAERPRNTAAQQVAASAGEWTLLLQLASDDEQGFMWGDNGFLYLWIRRDDLAHRRFERAHLVLQCF